MQDSTEMVVDIVAHHQFDAARQTATAWGCDNGPDIVWNNVEIDEHDGDGRRAIHEIRRASVHAVRVALTAEGRVLVRSR